ncbi:DUF4197 domain-containing protein [Curvivirga sp.]|uniref:DUF4197 domain-containing protein n=1 Tax=Curvivirga sp. TaxID=2856848 RepID=UPI003B5AA428
MPRNRSVSVLSILTALPLLTAFSTPKAEASSWLDKLQNVITETGVTESENSGGSGVAGLLSNEEVIEGLKEALNVGVQTVVGQLGAADGFNGDPKIHIPLPKELTAVQSTLSQFGLSSMADDIELRLNRGAEAAMPKARDLVLKAIQDMSFEDAKAIYEGPQDAATSYFRKVSTSDLKQTISPVIDQSLQDVGAIQAYDQLVGEYDSIPFMPDLKADLTDHATDLALEGLFHYLALEEAAIRENPAQYGKDILLKLFGQ